MDFKQYFEPKTRLKIPFIIKKLFFREFWIVFKFENRKKPGFSIPESHISRFRSRIAEFRGYFAE